MTNFNDVVSQFRIEGTVENVSPLPIGLTLSTVPSIRNCDTTSLKLGIVIY